MPFEIYLAIIAGLWIALVIMFIIARWQIRQMYKELEKVKRERL